MSDQVPKSYQEDFVTQQRLALTAYKERSGFSWDVLAKRSDIKRGTLSAFGGGTYQGNAEDVAKRVQQYLESEEKRRGISRNVKDGPAFEMTPTAEKICNGLTYAHSLGGIAAIVGQPGLGKSVAFRRYVANTPNAFLATMRPEITRINKMLVEIAEGMGIHTWSYHTLRGKIVSKIENANALLIVDEAHHLDLKLIDSLRNLNDVYGLAIVLAGNFGVLGNVSEARAEFAQLSSRVGLKIQLKKPAAGDISAYVAAWGVEDPEVISLLRTIGMKPGALRNIYQTMRFATLLAAGADREQVSAKDVRDAWENMAASEFGS